MKTRHHAFPAFLMMLVLLVGLHSARADVHDNAKFFSEDVVRQANFDLREIKQKHGKDLRVETHPTLPAELQSQMNAQNKDKLFADWAQQRGRDAKLDGVIILITCEPSHLQIGVGNKTQQKAFSLRDRDRMKDQMLTAFRQKQYDAGLLGAVQLFRETLANNLGGTSAQVEPASPSATPAPGSPQSNPGAFDPRGADGADRSGGGISFGSILVWFAIIMVGVWIIRRLFRRRTAPAGGMMGQPGYGRGYGNQPGHSSQPGYGDQPGYGYGRGGGLGTGLGGGILGGLLGGWLGSHMFGHGSGGGNAAHGATPPPAGGGQEPGVFSPEHDANFASSGGDFGGGSDFGGGGGDFGGGDFGGGGDSGGGGDF